MKRKLKCKLPTSGVTMSPFLKGTIFTFCVATIFFAANLYFSENKQCLPSLSSKYVKETLQRKLYGQKTAIDSIEAAIISNSSVKIFAVIGGTGVGKTYMSQIIVENSRTYCNIQYLLQHSMFSMNTVYIVNNKIRLCNYSLIIVDDLTITDLNNVKNFIQNVLSENTYIQNLDLFIMFNTDPLNPMGDEGDSIGTVRNLILSYLNNLEAEIHIIQFEKMSMDSIKLCAKDALKKYLIETSEENVNQLMELVPVNVDGCKEIFSKASLLYESSEL